MNTKDLLEQRAAAVAKAREVINTADNEKRNLNSEEQSTVDQWFAEADTLTQTIETQQRKERVENTERSLRESAGRKVSETGSIRNAVSDNDRKESLRAWALHGTDKARNGSEVSMRAADCGIRLDNNVLSVRALAKGSSTVPVSFSSEIDKALAFYCQARQFCRVLETATGEDITYPKVTDVANTATLVAEAGSITDATDPTFSNVSLKAYKFATTIIRLSDELLADNAVNIESLLAELGGERLGRGEGGYFSTGSGTSQPQGYVTAAASAVNLASTNVMVADKIIDLIYATNRAYRVNGKFVAHDTTIASIRKLKSSDNQYIWQPGLTLGEPDRLLGYPIYADNNMATSGDDAKLVLFGDFSKMLIRDVGPSLQVKRLNELYAATGEVGFVFLHRTSMHCVGPSGCINSLNAQNT
jgi:HK97 family phage major capsid protein